MRRYDYTELSPDEARATKERLMTTQRQEASREGDALIARLIAGAVIWCPYSSDPNDSRTNPDTRIRSLVSSRSHTGAIPPHRVVTRTSTRNGVRGAYLWVVVSA